MKRYRLLLIPLVLIIGLLLYFQPGRGPKQQNVNLGDVREVVSVAQTNTEKVSGYKYNTNVAVGSQIRVAITNRVITSDPIEQMVDFSWDIPNMSGTASMYAKGTEIYVFHPMKDKWVLPEEEPTISPFMDYFWQQLDLVDPVSNILKVDAAGNNVSIVNEPDDEGPDAVAVQVIPRGAALAEISKSLPPQLKGAELKDVRQLFWISKKDMMVTRYEVRANVSFFGLKTMDFKTVSKAADYDNVEINLPKPLLEKMKKSK